MLGVTLLQKCFFLISFMQVQFAQAIAQGGRIGYNAMKAQYPFMARLDMDGEPCGGTVISDRIIATSRHCITSCPCFPERNWNLCLNICFVKLRENSDQQADTETVHTIQAVHLPEKSGDPYQEPKGDRTDLALLELTRSVNHCEEKASTRDCWPIRKVRLPDPDIQIRIGDAVRTLGWGATAFEQDSEYLKRLDISIRTLTSFDHLIETNLSPGGGDPCRGDSGGPLLIRNKEDFQWTLIATLLGGGVDCDARTSFLDSDFKQDNSSDWNKLTLHLPWIKKIIKATANAEPKDPVETIEPVLRPMGPVLTATQNPSTLNPSDQSPSVRLSAVVATCGILPPPDFTHAVSGEGEINAPWAVSIGEYVKEDWIHSCTGSMITSSIILTAAHCITSAYYHQPSFWIKAGLNNPQNSRGGQESKIRKSVVHDNWLQEGERILYYDIGLMFIGDPFILGNKIALLCLPVATQPPTNSLPPSMVGANIITVGWGRNDDDVIGAEITSIEYAIRSQMECNSKYNTTSGQKRKGLLRQLPRLIEDTQFCGENSLSDDIGTCNGDSGGPTFVRNWINDRERFTIVGVTSGSPGCGGKLPDFYTFVAHEEVLSWIHKSVAEDEVGNSIFNHLIDGRSVICQEDSDCASDDCIEGICNPLYTRASRLGPSRHCNSVGSNRLCYDGTSCVAPRCNQFMDSCWCPAQKRNRRVAMETDIQTEVGNSTSFTFVDGAPEDWEIECSTDKDCPSEWFCEDEFCFAPYTFPSAAWKSLSAPIAGGISTIQISDTNTPTPSWRCPNGGWLHCNSNNRCWCNKRWNRRMGGK